MSRIELRGITWDHTRGYVPLVATAQRFSELRPEVSIQWEKRSLQEFADHPLERLVERFDLLVIDHPSVGKAAEDGLLAALDGRLPAGFLEDQAANSVGRSHESYAWQGRHWALAIDAATPVSGWRPDLLETPPATWSELLALAGRGLVVIPGIPIDTLCHFYMLCTALGERPFSHQDLVVSGETGARALAMLRDLMRRAAPGCERRSPIDVWELLGASDAAAYCPFAYGYANYSRPGYCAHPLQFGALVTLDSGGLFCSTLGGAGLAVSARCRHLDVAMEYAMFTAGADCQRGLYFDAGGQPGHRVAWLDERVNAASGNFFRNTLATLDQAWVRPRWHGYLDFQDRAGRIVHDCVWGDPDAGAVIDELNTLARQTRNSEVR